MSGVTREIKLNKVVNKLSDKENCVARIAQRYSLDYDAVLDEVIERGVLRITKPMLKMILEHTLETMIENTLKDGYSRRLGDYFMLQMEVSGRFDSPADQFDDERHKLSLKLRPLKALKRKPGRDDVRVYNRNAGPKVSIDRIYSVSTPDKDTLVFGDDIVLEGENLYFLEDFAEISDNITVGYYTQRRRGPMTMSSSGTIDGTVSEDGRRMVLSWDATVGQILAANKGHPDADPAQNPPVAVMVALRSRGGVSTAKQQLHRARAFFDTWKKKYPKYTFKGMSWDGL